LKWQSSFAVYRLPTKESKRPLSTSVFGKQTEVCRFHFSFAAKKRTYPLPKHYESIEK
jgi:hypothetical protein